MGIRGPSIPGTSCESWAVLARRSRLTARPAVVARPAGFETATIRLEGGCSIQRSYGRVAGPSQARVKKVVGVERFEAPTFCSQSRLAARLRYTPTTTRYDMLREEGMIPMPSSSADGPK